SSPGFGICVGALQTGGPPTSTRRRSFRLEVGTVASEDPRYRACRGRGGPLGGSYGGLAPAAGLRRRLRTTATVESRPGDELLDPFPRLQGLADRRARDPRASA